MRRRLRAGSPGRAALGLLAFALATWVANRIKLHEHIRAHEARHAIYPAARVAGASALLFIVCGFPLARVALPERLRRFELLWVLPLGAAAAAVELALLGYAFVPFDVAVVVVVGGGALGSLVAVRRRGPGSLPSPLGSVGWPLYLAALIGAFALLPLWHFGYPTVLGDGQDAHLAAGTARFLQSHHPLAHATGLPVDQVPLVWRSKTPIYYLLAAIAHIGGVPTWQALAPALAVVLGVAVVGIYVLARELLRAGTPAALAAALAVGLDPMVLHTIVHPYYNQSWGFAMIAPALLLAWEAVRRPARGSVALLVLVLAVCGFAYPLAVPLPLLGLAAFWVFDRRARGLRALPVPDALRGHPWAAGGLIGLALAVPVFGVLEKLGSGITVIFDPSSSLAGWGGDLDHYFAVHRFLSLQSGEALWIAAPLGALACALALRRLERPVAWGLLALLAVGAAGAIWFRARAGGQYFDFKLLMFTAPFAVALAVVGAARVPLLGTAAIVALLLSAFHGAEDELYATGNQLNPAVVALGRIPALIGPNRSLRLDMNPGFQLWVAYFLASERLCSERPLFDTSYPHVAVSRNAQFILADHGTFRPFDAAGAPIAYVGQFRLYREHPGVPGADRCSQGRVQTVKSVGLA